MVCVQIEEFSVRLHDHAPLDMAQQTSTDVAVCLKTSRVGADMKWWLVLWNSLMHVRNHCPTACCMCEAHWDHCIYSLACNFILMGMPSRISHTVGCRCNILFQLIKLRM